MYVQWDASEHGSQAHTPGGRSLYCELSLAVLPLQAACLVGYMLIAAILTAGLTANVTPLVFPPCYLAMVAPNMIESNQLNLQAAWRRAVLGATACSPHCAAVKPAILFVSCNPFH
jgi:hypothetical protein